MRTSNLSGILRNRYHNASSKEVVLSIHIFGIEFASELQNQSINDICTDANVPISYVTEIRKGMRLAQYVDLKNS